MKDSLFRKEVIEFKANTLMGNVYISNPNKYSVFIFLLLFIFISLAGFIYYGSYLNRETVNGYLVPEEGEINVYAPYPGRITSSYKKNGDHVLNGEFLYEVSTSKISKDNTTVNQQFITQLDNRKSLLKAKIKNEELLFEEEKISLNRLIQSKKREIIQLEKELFLLTEQVQISLDQKRKYENLFKKKLINQIDLTQRENDYINAMINLENGKRQKINLMEDVTNFSDKLKQNPLMKKKTLQGLKEALIDLEERFIELSSEEKYRIQAPINGLVTSTRVHKGQSVNSDIPLLTIIPENTKLYAELFLPSKSIGFVEKGQVVLIKYDSFPYQRYGFHKGIISDIALSTTYSKNRKIISVTEEPVYKVKVELTEQSILAKGKKLSLHAGMQLSAEIILDEISFVELLFKPLYELKSGI